MSKFITFYNIFVASPSDIVEEKNLVREIIDNWNTAHKGTDIQIEPVSWDSHARPEMGDTAQSIINRQLIDDCDFALCFFGNRLGTKTENERSGTVEEIEKFSAAGKPVLIYFSKGDIPRENFDIDQFQKLEKYREHCKSKGLVSEYESIDKLKDLLQKHITQTIFDLHKKKGDNLTTYPYNDESRDSQLDILYKRLCFFHQKFDVEFDLIDFKKEQFSFRIPVINQSMYSNEERLYSLLEEIETGLWEINGWLFEDEFENTISKITSLIITIKNFKRLLKQGTFNTQDYADDFKKLKKVRQDVLDAMQFAIAEFHETLY